MVGKKSKSKEKTGLKKLEDYKTLGKDAKKVEEVKEEKVEENKDESKPAVAKISKKEEKKEVVIELEGEYVVPLRKGSMKVPRYKRAKKAVKTLKEFLAKHMRVENRDLKKVKIDINLNNEIWFRGIKKPANKIKVKAVKRGGIVYAELAEVPEIVLFNKAKLLNRKNRAETTKKKVKEEKKEEIDKDKDGVVDKVEEIEDRKAAAEKSEITQRTAVKEKKHTAKAKTGKQENQLIHRKALKR